MADLMTTKQLAGYLQLSERSVYRLLERGEVPAVRVGGRWRFRRTAVDKWLDLGVGPSEPAEPGHPDAGLMGPARVSISDLISPANVIRDLPPGGRAEVLGALVGRLHLPEPIDRAQLLARLLERESLCTTAMADGVAVPHTLRGGSRLLAKHDVVALARTREPVAFGALDGGKTDVLFLVLARDEPRQMMLLSKVSRMIREKSLLRLLRSSVDADALIRSLRDAELALFRESAGGR
jgi:PTS system nitrogen regulatory IIA component